MSAGPTARPGFNRWLVPPCGLAIHLCIGMASGFSVFWLPLSRALGIARPIECQGMTLARALVTTRCDWHVSNLVWVFTLFFLVLGATTWLCGAALDQAGPRRAGLLAAICWCGGLCIAALAVRMHVLWLLWLGAGFVGGIGLGVGYISPVATFLRWFPDRRGMATGLAIMGFGGGALVGSPLAALLMKHFSSATTVGVWQSMLALAGIYAVFMFGGALGYRVPPEGWAPPGWNADTARSNAFHVHHHRAPRTVQFWLVWLVLLLNVSPFIGVIGLASPMLQEIFGGALVGNPAMPYDALTLAQKRVAASAGAGFVGIISLFNSLGRLFWSAISDRIGRWLTYASLFSIACMLYLLAPMMAGAHLGGFIVLFCLMASLYGGGFATAPAYLADIFGTRHVGAIHGRLLTAWSAAALIGPLLIAYIRDARIAEGVPRAEVYRPIFIILAALPAAGCVANLLVRPVHPRHHLPASQVPVIQSMVTADPRPRAITISVVAAWSAVCLPIAWGVAQALDRMAPLLR